MTPGGDLAGFVRRMPKVELHVHLEGSIEPSLLLRLARRRGVTLPAEDEAGLRAWFRFQDFEQFAQIYLACCACLRDPEDFQEVALAFMARQARLNVVYSEVHFTIGTHLRNGANGEEVACALSEAMADGERRHGVRMRLIPDVVRNVGADRADATLRWALDHRRHGVVALGLTGYESEPNEPFRGHFREAAAEGLHAVAHAGEHGGPDSIRSVIEVCRPERIGHGITAVEDPLLMAELRRRGLPLEVCPTSNLRLGAVARAKDHPVDRLLEAGVPLSLGSDDPAMFDTDLERELLLVQRTFGYGASRLAGLSLAALRHSFLPAGEREGMEEAHRRAMAALAEELLEEPLEL